MVIHGDCNRKWGTNWLEPSKLNIVELYQIYELMNGSRSWLNEVCAHDWIYWILGYELIWLVPITIKHILVNGFLPSEIG